MGFKEKTANDYFLAGNTLTWWAVGASLIAANISAEQFKLSSKDVITLIPFLGTPVLQAIFIWRLLSLLTKWLDVGLMCGNFCYVAAIRFVMCNELTSFRGNFMPHTCPITSPDNHQTHPNAHR